MKKANCARCGKREGLHKSHERVKFLDKEFYLCVGCSQIAYKMKDAVKDGNTILAAELEDSFLALPREKDALLSSWFEDFKVRLKK